MSLGVQPPEEPEPDRELARRMPPPQDWDAIVKRWNHRVIVSLLSMGLRIDRAKELAQNTWMRLLEQHRHGKLDELEFPGLALAQARYLALDELRRARAENHRLQPLDTELTIADGAPNAELSLLSREQLSRALDVLAECPANAQRIFRLAYDEPSMPHAEVAEEVGLSVQRVRQILCETRKKVRAAMEEVER